MSHLKERKEKNCLNCNARVEGRYCHICGQENVETRESAWHLVTHFFQDITHYDGKFFSTLRLLISRPGFLSAEYIRGRRASYLNPIRMYVFTSAFFFLIFFTFFKSGKNALVAGWDWRVNGKTFSEVMKMDSTAFSEYTKAINSTTRDRIPMSRDQFRMYYDSVVQASVNSDDFNVINVTGATYKSEAEYDSLLKSGKLKHNWLEEKVNRKQLAINQRYRGRGKDALRDLGDAFVHKLPQLLFVSLPLLALLLKLMYRRSRSIFYVDHGIFSIHLYIFIFIALLVQLAFGKLYDQLHWPVIDFLRQLIVFGIFFYAYKALRNFYQQRRAKTVIKFMLLSLLFMMVMVILMLLFFIFSVLSI